MISINATLVLQVVQLLILVYILNRLVFRPILKLINDRTTFVEKSKEEIKKIEIETERLRKDYHTKQGGERKSASKEGQRLKTMGLAKVEEIMDQSLKEAASIRMEALKKAAEQIDATKPHLGDKAMALSDEIVERMIGRRVPH